MARSAEQNRLARERARESLVVAAIDVFAERGIDGATIAEITSRAGVAQGLVNYHFGGKDQLILAVVDRWFEMLFGIAHGEGEGATAVAPSPAVLPPPDGRLAGIIDTVLGMTAHALPLQRVIVALQQQPATRALFAEAERRHLAEVTAAEDAVRSIFRERGEADPAVEEIMLRSLLDGIVGQCIIYGDSYPLESARRWVHRQYGLPAPTTPLQTATVVPEPGAGRGEEPRARASNDPA
ncbi:helix-turn-helix domain-containing protein [Microbacterium capsulatum]|uniref:Helix-turn-helix domain-containing protein n=1 Tax=Microbacterium capsulatum TaxID=3041921 RepID=A0ABU0XIJ3_9MICO|nr:helix-turn-helix domain-containing protein [Microbacterium sp. ASV81]MDQ4214960.1 helix-turn-helix domain-containing protein [Microbacterium sp. ASV81]